MHRILSKNTLKKLNCYIKFLHRVFIKCYIIILGKILLNTKIFISIYENKLFKNFKKEYD